MANERKVQIIKAAAKRFARHGTGKTTLDEIARDIRIGKATIYHYFPSKDELYYETVEWECSRYITEIKAIFNNEAIDLRERFAEYFEFKSAVPVLFKLLNDIVVLLLKDDSFDKEREILSKLFKSEEDILKLVFSSVYSSRIESVNPALPIFFVISSWGISFGERIGQIAQPERKPVTREILIKSLDAILE